MHVFVDISGHGFGHLALTAPVLNALAAQRPALRLTVRSPLPHAQLQTRIEWPFDWIDDASDFGFVMHDALRVDLAASAEAYRHAHARRPQRLAAERALLHRLQPDLVLSCVSDLPLAAAHLAGTPAAAVCSLNWADLFQHYFGGEPWAPPIHAELLAAYQGASGFLRCTPAMPMPALGNTVDIGPIARLGRRHRLFPAGERSVLVAMGGIAHAVPVDAWPRLPGVRWLVPAGGRCSHPDARSWESFGLGFTDVLCSVDAVLTKPGYGTFTEAACNGVPLLYQRRPDWPEQDCLIDWLGHCGVGAEIDPAALAAGRLGPALAALWARPRPPTPAPTGAVEAATLLAQWGGRRLGAA